jgi:GNAT superfamily N-acetyltransferase
MPFTHRLATEDDLNDLRALMAASITLLQKAFLSEEQIEASRQIMGLDSQLIVDRTYFVIEDQSRLAGCGGWSRRATLYGGDHAKSRDARLLDPATEPARIRAMYTAPDYARKGVGRLILALCEQAAAEAGFQAVELGGTLSGEPLYAACGYHVIERIEDTVGAVKVPLLRMGKSLTQKTEHDAATSRG